LFRKVAEKIRSLAPRTTFTTGASPRLTSEYLGLPCTFMALLKSCAILQSSWVATVTGRKDSDARYADCLLLDQLPATVMREILTVGAAILPRSSISL